MKIKKSTKNIALLMFLLLSQALLFTQFGLGVKGDEYYRFDPEKTFEYNNSNDFLYNDSFNRYNMDRMSVKHPRSSTFDFSDNKSLQVESGLQDYTYDFNYNMLDGYHLATYFDHYNLSIFDGAEDLNFPTSYYEDSGCSVDVVDGDFVSGGKFKHVVQLDDTSTSGSARLYREFDTHQTDDFYEWWWGKNDTSADTDFSMSFREQGSPDTWILYLSLRENDLYQGTGGGTLIHENFLEADTMYHFKLEFDDNLDEYDLWINQENIVDGGATDETFTDGIDKISIETINNHEVKGYISSLATITRSSWYNEDMNINEHRLTDFKDSEMRPDIRNIAYCNNIDTIPVGDQEYNATETFIGEAEKEGTDIEFVGWLRNGEYPESVSVETEYQEHKNVLVINDTSEFDYQVARHYFDTITLPEYIEFWVTGDVILSEQYSADSGMLSLIHQNNELFYRTTESGYSDPLSINTNQWNHIKITYNYTAETVNVYLNTKKVLIDIPMLEVYEDYPRYDFRVGSNSEGRVDGFAIETDSDYKSGDNLHWNNYEGSETFEQYDISTNAASQLEAEGWDITEADNTSVGISGEFNSHKKFLNLTDNSEDDYIDSYYNFDSSYSSGIVEEYFKVSDVNKRFYPLYLMGDSIAVHLYIDNGNLYYYDGSSHNIDSTIQSNEWYHLKVGFDCSSYTYDIYLNNILISEDTPFHNNLDSVNKARFRTYIDSNYSVYLDSLSFSWDSSYHTNYSQTKETLIGETLYSKINQSYNVNKDLGLNLNSITVSFDYKFEINNDNFSSYALFNQNTNLNTNGSWISYSVSYSQAFSLDFNISNGILEVRDFEFQEATAITQSEASTDNNSVIIKKAFYSYRAFKYWYLEDSHSINSLTLKHNRTGETISDFSNESSRYFFEKDCNEGDVFIATIDYDPNWVISYDFTQNNATYTKVKVSYKADLTIYNVSLILDLRNSNIFDNFGSNTRVLLRLTIEDINFTSNTQTLYIEGFRNQLTTNPEVSANSVNFNETFYYNSELISQDTVDINPNYQISEDYQNTNSTETDIQFSYKSDVPINNVTYTPTLNIEGMFDNSWQLNNNFSSINFALNPLNFTETLQTKTLQTNLTQTTSNPTTSIDSVYYNLRVYDNSDVLLTKSLDIDPGFSTDFSYYIANSMYSKIRLDYLANIHCENVTHKISIDILQAFGNNWELNTNLTTYQITINEIDFTDTINYLDISSNLTQITANPTTSTDSVDFRFKYYRGSNLLLQSDLDIDPGFQVSYTVENSTTFSIAGKVRYKADLNISNVDLHLNKKRSNMFNDLLTLNNNQDNNNVSLTLSNLSFTEVLQTTYICGNRVQLNASARTDLDSVHFTETYTWNNSTLNSYTINVDPNFYVSYDIITTQSKYTKLKITYRADLAINNVSLILNLNDYCFGVNFTLVSTKITINELNFRASSKYFYIEGYRTQHTRNPRTDQETVQFNQTFYYSGNMIKTSTVSIDPQWQISYEILVNNGTYSKLRITYSSILSLNDVSIVLDLTNSSCYNENWTLSAYQDLDFILTIPNIDFTTQSQRIYIEGFSSIPYATITGFESDQNFNRLAIDEEVEFVAFLNFSKFSEIFLINISKNWECFYVFYPNDTYNVQYINDYQIQFSGKGFDPKVNSSYLYFKTKPFSTVNFTYSNDNDTIEIVIYSEFDVNNSYFFHRFNDESNHELVILYNTTSITGLSDYGDYEGYLFFKCNNITEGYTVIVIYVDKAEGIEFWIQAIPILAIAGISVGVFYYLKFNEKALEKIKSFVSDKVIDRLKRNEGQLENVKISQKGDEINIKFKD